jgi:hypothetical protein
MKKIIYLFIVVDLIYLIALIITKSELKLMLVSIMVFISLVLNLWNRTRKQNK